eukprot:gene14008-biopygen364
MACPKKKEKQSLVRFPIGSQCRASVRSWFNGPGGAIGVWYYLTGRALRGKAQGSDGGGDGLGKYQGSPPKTMKCLTSTYFSLFGKKLKLRGPQHRVGPSRHGNNPFSIFHLAGQKFHFPLYMTHEDCACPLSSSFIGEHTVQSQLSQRRIIVDNFGPTLLTVIIQNRIYTRRCPWTATGFFLARICVE